MDWPLVGEEHARTLGKTNLPLTSAVEPGTGEVDVISVTDEMHTQVAQITADAVRDAAAKFDAMDEQLPSSATLESQTQSALADIQRDLAGNRTLGDLWRTREDCRRDREVFRQEHWLHREARYPTSLLLQLGLLFALIVLEAALNCLFFAQASSRGLIGGFLLASAASFANVGLGVATGFVGLRYAAHRNPPLKRRGWMLVFALVPVALAWNLAVARFRDASLPSGLSSADQHSLGLSLSSWGLLAIGCAIWAIALYEGYQKLDDPYPGYGRVDRAFRAADERYRRERDALLCGVLKRLRQIPVDADTLVLRSAKLLTQLDRYAGQAQGTIQDYDAIRSRLSARCELSLRHWRAANLSARSTPAPEYFTQYPEFPDHADREILERLLSRRERARREHEALKAAAHRAHRDNPQHVRAAAEEFDEFLRTRLGSDEAGVRRAAR